METIITFEQLMKLLKVLEPDERAQFMKQVENLQMSFDQILVMARDIPESHPILWVKVVKLELDPKQIETLADIFTQPDQVKWLSEMYEALLAAQTIKDLQTTEQQVLSLVAAIGQAQKEHTQAASAVKAKLPYVEKAKEEFRLATQQLDALNTATSQAENHVLDLRLNHTAAMDRLIYLRQVVEGKNGERRSDAFEALIPLTSLSVFTAPPEQPADPAENKAPEQTTATFDEPVQPATDEASVPGQLNGPAAFEAFLKQAAAETDAPAQTDVVDGTEDLSWLRQRDDGRPDWLVQMDQETPSELGATHVIEPLNPALIMNDDSEGQPLVTADPAVSDQTTPARQPVVQTPQAPAPTGLIDKFVSRQQRVKDQFNRDRGIK